jgi:hypothetical protein
MRIDRRMSPNQTALWTLYELHNSAGQRHAAVLLRAVNSGQPRTL